MFIVSPSTLYNFKALETRNVPKRMIGRISIIPRQGASWRLIGRLIFEVQVLRYLTALAPFVLAMLIWPHLALPISQAPIPMLIVIALVETKVLNMPKEKREALMSDDEMHRVKDALNYNSKRILTRFVARHGHQRGEFYLVVEQSELARVRPLTLVSVQTAHPNPMVLALDAEDREMITDLLFDDIFDEAALHCVTLHARQNLHHVVLDARSISAHARMAALTRKTAPQASPRKVQL